MSKAVLVIDMPESCMSCKLKSRLREPVGEGITHCCNLAEDMIKSWEGRLTQCPLKPLPEKMQVYGRYPQPDGITPSYKIGYNRCLKEIGGDNG